jgi:hypothetical protein
MVRARVSLGIARVPFVMTQLVDVDPARNPESPATVVLSMAGVVVVVAGMSMVRQR